MLLFARGAAGSSVAFRSAQQSGPPGCSGVPKGSPRVAPASCTIAGCPLHVWERKGTESDGQFYRPDSGFSGASASPRIRAQFAI